MEKYNPFYQVEVRYSPLFNFTSFYRDIIMPYLKLSTRIAVDNENSFKERFHLLSEDDKYMIYLSWDRIYLRSQGNIEDMIQENSVVENVFLPLLDDIKKVKYFEKIENILLFVSTISFIEEQNNKQKLVSIFMDKYIKTEAKNLLDSINDIGLELVEKSDKKEITMAIGPYFGLDDLKKRKAQPPFEIGNEDIELDRIGQIAEIKIFEKSNEFDFKKFKELVLKYKDYYAKLQV